MRASILAGLLFAAGCASTAEDRPKGGAVFTLKLFFFFKQKTAYEIGM
mgnify:CR=1 FL=1